MNRLELLRAISASFTSPFSDMGHSIIQPQRNDNANNNRLSQKGRRKRAKWVRK